MIVSINQPAYLPWIGYFHRIAVSDLHIVLNHVQFEKNSFTNRNKIRTKEGACWLTVPLKTKGLFGHLAINQVEIANEQAWAAKHWNALRMNYSRAPYFADHAPFFDEVFSRQWGSLQDLMKVLTGYLLTQFNITTPLVYSSEMDISGRKDALVLNICRSVGATIYLSGPLGKQYLREELFREAGIRVVYHAYQHPSYSQVYPGFEAYMAAVDLLFNFGPKSRVMIVQSQENITT